MDVSTYAPNQFPPPVSDHSSCCLTLEFTGQNMNLVLEFDCSTLKINFKLFFFKFIFTKKIRHCIFLGGHCSQKGNLTFLYFILHTSCYCLYSFWIFFFTLKVVSPFFWSSFSSDFFVHVSIKFFFFWKIISFYFLSIFIYLLGVLQ